MNKNKNPNLPANAIACTDVEVGMRILDGTWPVEVTAVHWHGFRGIIEAGGTRIRVNAAGTLRLA